ncbi:MAG: hypothetical protein MK086_00785 [Flavobacteriales bacterium]|nr:hypothetical protein [Flavobacteriales bacterium]
MRLLLFVLSFSVIGFSHAQTTASAVDRRDYSNEIKFNAATAVAELFEISYERIMNDDMGLGGSLAYFSDENLNYRGSILPFFRFYPGEKRRAAGLFFEVNSGVIFSQNDEFYYVEDGIIRQEEGENFVSFGFGVAVGGKFISRTGLFGEIYVGLGREFVDESFVEAYPRVGLNFGYRF